MKKFYPERRNLHPETKKFYLERKDFHPATRNLQPEVKNFIQRQHFLSNDKRILFRNKIFSSRENKFSLKKNKILSKTKIFFYTILRLGHLTATAHPAVGKSALFIFLAIVLSIDFS